MNRQTKQLLALAGVLAVGLGAYAALRVWNAGEEEREAGERLAASYVNFYFSNEAVILPAFGGENEESDRRAAALLAQWNPGRKIIPVQARAILVGGGNIHCITQQIPAAKK